MSTTPNPDTDRTADPFEQTDAARAREHADWAAAARAREHAAWLADVFTHLPPSENVDRATDLLREIAADRAAPPEERLDAARALRPLDSYLAAQALAKLATDPVVDTHRRLSAAAALCNLGRAVGASDPLPAGAEVQQAQAVLAQAHEELTAALRRQPDRPTPDDPTHTTRADTIGAIDLLVDFELSSLGTARARAARRRTPPATVGQILARSHDLSPDPDPDTPDTARLLAELNELRHRDGLQDPDLRIGPVLSRMAGLRPDDDAQAIRLRLAHLLVGALQHLPHNLATTFIALTNLNPRQRHRPLAQRIDLLASQDGVTSRTVRLRWDKAAGLVAEYLLQHPEETAPPDRPDGQPPFTGRRLPRPARTTRRSETTR